MTRALGALFVLGFGVAAPAAQAAPVDLQSPEQRDLRNSAYSLPGRTWAFDVSAFGVSGSDALAQLGIGYGLGAGFQLELNLAHTSVGLLNLTGRYHFLDTPHFDLGARVGVWYGQGQWFWVLSGPKKELMSDLDVLSVPLALVSSMPVSRSLQFDFEVKYTYAEVFGSLVDSEALFIDAQFGTRQFELRPGARLFLSDRTELDISSSLPLYTAVAAESERSSRSGSKRNERFETVSFSDVWSLEAGLRSRFSKGFFGTIRLHYGRLAEDLYGSTVNPSFDLEFRL